MRKRHPRHVPAVLVSCALCALACGGSTTSLEKRQVEKTFCLADVMPSTQAQLEGRVRAGCAPLIPACAQQCLAGNLGRCWSLIESLASATDPAERGHYRDALTYACGRGLASACVWAANDDTVPMTLGCRARVRERASALWEFDDDTRRRLDVEAPGFTRAVFEAACRRGDPAACERAARLWVDLPLGAVEAVRLLGRACELGDDQACVDILPGSTSGLLERAQSDRARGASSRVGSVDLDAISQGAWPSLLGGGQGLVPTGTAARAAGSLSADAIRAVVRGHLGEVRQCYEEVLQRAPDLQGTVSIRFMINPGGGVVTSVVSGSTVGEANLEECIRSAVLTWRFPPPEGGGLASVTYPFTFQTN